MNEVEFKAPAAEMVVSDDLAKAKRLLKSAVKAAETLAEDVAELIRMRAWQVMGYPNFSDMWEAETGLKCPTQVQNMAALDLRAEGMNTNLGQHLKMKGANGHTQVDIARMVGLPVSKTSHGLGSASVGKLFQQYDFGVPVDKITKTGRSSEARKKILEYGDPEKIKNYVPRARNKVRKLGIADDDHVAVGFGLPKRYANAVNEIARKAGIPNAEIYRQAVAEYLARLNEGGAR